MTDSNAPATVRPKSIVRSIGSAIPTLLVLGLLGAVGYWGHHTGWRAGAFSELLWSAPVADPEDWCELHNVPDSRCIACNPALAGESAADWCKEHGVPESRCTTCHPEILETGVAADWCREHGLPESGCTICHPEIARLGKPAPEDGEVTAIVDAASAKPATPVRNPATCQTHALKVQFASKDALVKAGIRLATVGERPMSDSLVVAAELDYDRTRLARVGSRVTGVATRVERDLGDRVEAGDMLALIDSAEIGKAKAEYLKALVAVDLSAKVSARLEASSAAGFRTETDRLLADSESRQAVLRLFDARQTLLNLGLPEPAADATQDSLARLGLPEAIARETTSANLFPLVAPLAGIIVSRSLVAGDVVHDAEPRFEIADTTRMWVTMHLPDADARRVAIGQQVDFQGDGGESSLSGVVTWMSTAVDERTRTVEVRAAVENPGGALRAHSFGRARIVIRKSLSAIAVPNEALQWEGCCHVVFVRLGGEIFQTRKLQLGSRDAAFTEVLGGVLPGEVVVTTGSHVLKSEILKSQLGAGCCAED